MSHIISKAQSASLSINVPATSNAAVPLSSSVPTSRRERHKFLAAFIAALLVVLTVHLLEFPGSVPNFRRESGGGELLDVKPSFSPEAIYSRLEAYGEIGRKNYMIRNVTVDVVLPFALLPFLVLLMGYAIGRFRIGNAARLFLISAPFTYVIFDLAENASVIALLANYPGRLEPLASVLPYLTLIKRAASMLALFAPVVILALAALRRIARTALRPQSLSNHPA
jgi:hypothetical protein